jgi:uncharacterized membrane protein HdeD (DUF308 family)
MNDKTEWEVVEADQPDPRRTPADMLKAMLGPWWRWKIGAAVVLASLALLFFVALAGVVVVAVLAFALLSVGIAKLRRWLRQAPEDRPRY